MTNPRPSDFDGMEPGVLYTQHDDGPLLRIVGQLIETKLCTFDSTAAAYQRALYGEQWPGIQFLNISINRPLQLARRRVMFPTTKEDIDYLLERSRRERSRNS